MQKFYNTPELTLYKVSETEFVVMSTDAVNLGNGDYGVKDGSWN